MSLTHQIFNIKSEQSFEVLALQVFRHQYFHNPIYHQFCKYLKIKLSDIKTVANIPFLPIEFFKTHTIKTGEFTAQKVFLSSGTTGENTSQHHVKDLLLYEKSFEQAFQQFYGEITDYCILGLLPSYLEREDSSLIYMVHQFIQKSKNLDSGFFLKENKRLLETLKRNIENKQKTILFGVSFALLDLAEQHCIDLKEVIIIETGGMKGRRKELTRQELHRIYNQSFNLDKIHSEYGMTELLSQAYSKGNGLFNTPPWMKISIRDVNDPFSLLPHHQTGGINVIDLANLHSCSFIATQDLGKTTLKGFEVLGRFDNSDLRGCNLMVSSL